MRRICASVSLLALLSFTNVAIADRGCDRLQTALGKVSAEARSLQAKSEKLEGDYRALCILGRKEGAPAYTRWLRYLEPPVKGQCAAKYQEMKANFKRIQANHSRAMKNDCKLAGM